MARKARPPITPPTMAPVLLVEGVEVEAEDEDEDELEDDGGKLLVLKRVCKSAESNLGFGLGFDQVSVCFLQMYKTLDV